MLFKKKRIQKRDFYVGFGAHIHVGFFRYGGKFEILTFIVQKRTLNPLIYFQVQRNCKAHNQPMILDPSYLLIALHCSVFQNCFFAPEDKAYPIFKFCFVLLYICCISNRMFVDQQNAQILFKMAYTTEPISAFLGTRILNF
jgi:hypothetical protein